VVSGSSSSIGRPPAARSSISIWQTTSSSASNSLSRRRYRSLALRSALSVTARGGLLSLALALRCQPEIACLALLATPWDFYAESIQSLHLARATDSLVRLSGRGGKVPVEAIQTLFYVLDPFTSVRKFIRFASLDPDSDEARSFVALEDWINDGVPLPMRVARSCARSWYRDNEPGRGLWRVAGQLVRPQALRRPALIVVPGRDRIVPPGSAEPLAAALGSATLLRPPLGHVGMMAAARAPDMLWTTIANWLRARLDER
jgi:poly[(R)-3-hydroxyalkanoate] polymerase subunit PhaC